MTSPTEPRTHRLYHGEPRAPWPAFDPVLATPIVAGSLATFLLVGAIVPPSGALIAGQLALLAVPVAAAVWQRRDGSPLVILGLTRPSWRAMAAAVLVGTTLWYVNLRAITVLGDHGWLPTSHDAQRLDQLVEQGSLASTLVTLALLPPLCEEILFRGVLARSLASRLPLVIAVAISAVVFSAYHFSLLQALPTFVLGLALATLALRGRSIVPAMLAHALNNGIAVLVTRGSVPELDAWIGRNPDPVLVGCLALASLGIVLAVVRP